MVPRVTRGCAKLVGMFEWKFGACSGASGPAFNLCESVLRFSERYASEACSRRYVPRLLVERLRASLFSADFPLNAAGLFLAAQDYWLPRQMSVDVNRLAAGVVSLEDLRGGGYEHQFTAHRNVLRHVFMVELYFPALSVEVRARVFASLAGAMDQTFHYLRRR